MIHISGKENAITDALSQNTDSRYKPTDNRYIA